MEDSSIETAAERVTVGEGGGARRHNKDSGAGRVEVGRSATLDQTSPIKYMCVTYHKGCRVVQSSLKRKVEQGGWQRRKDNNTRWVAAGEGRGVGRMAARVGQGLGEGSSGESSSAVRAPTWGGRRQRRRQQRGRRQHGRRQQRG